MKKTIFMAVILSVILSATISCNKFKSDNWVAKIEYDVISVDDFNKMYYTQNRIMLNLEKDEIDKMAADPSTLNPQVQQLVIKKSFLDQLVAQKVIYNKAMADESINKDELKTIMEISKLQAVSQYYMSQKLKGKISVTDQEIDKFYKENQKYFKGVPVDDSLIGKIKQQIFMEKAKLESNEIIMNLLAEVRINKEGFKKYMEEQNKKQSEKPKENKPAADKK
jgi:hypothetical protein